jgi:hypothetical protein
MIPTLLVLGFLAGLLPRGWLFVGVAAFGWPLLLVGTGVDGGMVFALRAGVLGAANALVGVSIGYTVRMVMDARIHR